MHTKDFLAQELRKAGLHEMAKKAETGYYHDYLSPLAMPCLQLDADLAMAGTPEALALRARHHKGEFDASKAESEEWMASEDGKETFAELLGPILNGKKPH